MPNACLLRRHPAHRGAQGVVALTGLALLAIAGAAAAQTLDSRLMASGLNQPLLATGPLADGRLFVVEKGRADQGRARWRGQHVSQPASGDRG